jgi:hypothetical protein
MPEQESAAVTVLPPARHEARDVSVRVALIGFALIGLVLVAIVLLPGWLFPAARTPTPASAPPAFAAPQLQPAPAVDMQEFRAAKLRWLNGTGWVDKSNGIVHVPIDDAIGRIAQSGVADWPTPSAGGAK